MAKATEFQLQPGKLPILVVEPYGSSFKYAIKTLRQDSSIQVAECSSSLDAAALARRLGICLVVCHVGVPGDVVKHGTMLKLLQQGIKRKEIRILVTAGIRDEGALSKLNLMGCTEILREPVSEKSLLFKVERHIRALPSVARGGAASGQGPTTERAAEITVDTRWADPLQIESDCWAYGRGPAKRIGGKWVIKLRGPRPAEGAWERLEGNRRIGWQWQPRDPDTDPYIKEEGAWVFFGQRPDYQDGTWTFIDKDPELSFFYEGKVYGSKISTEGRGTMLVIARDSTTAVRSLEEAARASRATSDAGVAAAADEPSRVASSSRAQPGRGHELVSEPPLDLESDCWLLDGRRPKLVTEKWVVTLRGPAPSAGRWAPIDGGGATDSANSGGDDPWWQWLPSDPEHDPFLKEEGAWVYRGLQPRFQEEAWVFVGRAPELAFYYEGESYGAKFSTDAEGNLHLARDSGAARSAVPAIEASLDRVIKTADPRSRGMEGGSEAGLPGVARAGGFSGSSVAAPEMETTFRFAREHFGKAGGEWEAASVGSQLRRWFVFVPQEVLDGKVPDIRRLGSYWTYFGPALPKLVEDTGAAEWAFPDRKPQATQLFSDLPPAIQQFLLDYFPGSALSATADAPAPSAEDPEDGRESSGEADASSDSGDSGNDHDAEDDREVPQLLKSSPRESSNSRKTRREDADASAEGSPSLIDRETFDGSEGEAPEAEALPALRKRRGAEPESEPAPKLRERAAKNREFRQEENPFLRGSRREESGSTREPDREDAPELDYGHERRRGSGAADGSGPGGAGTRDTTDGVLRFRIPGAHFGTPGGEWEAASFGSKLRRWFVFVPAEVLSGEAVDIRKLTGYWTYFGEVPQAEDDAEGTRIWVFKQRRPQAVTHWADLPSAVQEFLISYFSPQDGAEAPGVAEAADEENAEGLAETEAGDAPGTESAEAGELVFELEDAPVLSRREPSVKGERASSGGEDAPEGPRSAPGPRARNDEDSPVETRVETGRVEDSAQLPALPKKSRKVEEPADLPAAEPDEPTVDVGWSRESSADSAELASPEEPREDGSAPEPRVRHARHGEMGASAAHAAALPEEVHFDTATSSSADQGLVVVHGESANPALGPRAVAAEHPPGPSLSPLALAFLAAELMCKREMDPKRMAQRYCAYLGASCGGLRAELWMDHGRGADDQSWFCAGTDDGHDGRFGDVILRLSAFTADSSGKLQAVRREGILFAPVTLPGPVGRPGRLLGVLALGGTGAELVEPAYLEAAARLVRGMAMALAPGSAEEVLRKAG